MLDLIKYLPLGWRERDNACTPRGPRKLSTRPINFTIGGSTLTFRAPSHSPDSQHNRSTEPNKYRQDQLSAGLRRYATGVMANDCWRSLTIFRREWAFWGPWMTGAKAQLAMAVSIIGRDEAHEYKDVSFFHPRVFENVVTDYLNDLYGHYGVGGGFQRKGPIDWNPIAGLPVFGANCRVFHFDPCDGELFKPENLMVFPITSKHFIEIAFDRRVYSKDRTGKPCFDTTPVDKLQEAITNSLQLELGPEAQAEWDRVAADCPDMSLTQHFAPLKWPVDPDNPAGTADDEPGKLTKFA